MRTRRTPSPASPPHAWDEGDDDEILDIWEMVFGLVIGDTLDAAAALDPDRSGDLDFSGHGAALAVTLFLARPDGLHVAEISEVIRAARDGRAAARPGGRGLAVVGPRSTAIPPGCFWT